MKNLNNYIQEGLKVNSKSRFGNILLSFNTIDEFIDTYKDQITVINKNAIEINDSCKLKDKISSVLGQKDKDLKQDLIENIEMHDSDYFAIIEAYTSSTLNIIIENESNNIVGKLDIYLSIRNHYIISYKIFYNNKISELYKKVEVKLIDILKKIIS